MDVTSSNINSLKYFLEFVIFSMTYLCFSTLKWKLKINTQFQTYYASTDNMKDDYADFFGESDGWNDFGGLWIDNNDYFVSNWENYIIFKDFYKSFI